MIGRQREVGFQHVAGSEYEGIGQAESTLCAKLGSPPGDGRTDRLDLDRDRLDHRVDVPHRRRSLLMWMNHDFGVRARRKNEPVSPFERSCGRLVMCVVRIEKPDDDTGVEDG